MKHVQSIILVLALSGCASVRTSPDFARSDLSYENMSNREAIEGVPYSLPMLQYDIAITYTLSECEPGAYFKISIKPEATSTFVPGERYVIDYEDLSSFWKTSSFAIENHEKSGTLKSINISVADKTADFLKAAAKTGLALSGIGTIPSAKLTDAKTPEFIACTDAAKSAIAAREALAGQLKDKTKILTDITSEIELLKLTVKFQNGGDAEQTIKNLIKDKRNAEEEVTKALKALVKMEKELGLSFKRRLTWPEYFYQLHHRVNVAKLPEKWTNKEYFKPNSLDAASPDGPATPCVDTWNGLDENKKNKRAPGLSYSIKDCLTYLTSVGISLVEKPTLPPCATKPVRGECLIEADESHKARINKADGDENAGVFIRPPVSGELRICRQRNADIVAIKTSDPDDSNNTGLIYEYRCNGANLIAEPAEIIPQLGQLRFLPFKNGPFENNNLVVELTEKGQLNKFEYKKTSAPATALASTAADITGQVDAYLNKRAEDRKKAADADRVEIATARAEELAILDHDIAVLKKNKELLELQNPDEPNAVAMETAALQAQIALLETRQKLLELQQQLSN